jgi:hypothetical protein
MNLDKFKRQHVDILADIAALRELVRRGIEQHADAIAARIIAMSGHIKLHLAVEDRVLYPALSAHSDAAIARMSAAYKQEMAGIVANYMAFAAKWNAAGRLQAEPDDFRAEANSVLRTLFERMRKEDHEFYPAVEALAGLPLAV